MHTDNVCTVHGRSICPLKRSTLKRDNEGLFIDIYNRVTRISDNDVTRSISRALMVRNGGDNVSHIPNTSSGLH